MKRIFLLLVTNLAVLMIAALEALRRAHEPLPSQQFAAFGITSGPASRGIRRLFMSHPPLDERIAALRALTAA